MLTRNIEANDLVLSGAIATVDGSPLKWGDGDYDPHGKIVAEGKERMFKTGLEAAATLAKEY